MWFKGGRAMGPSALVGVIALVVIEYAANGGALVARPPPSDPTFHARLERGLCYGACPVYTVDIDATGAVTFVGRKSATEPSAPCQGERHWRTPPAAVAKLEAQVEASGFFGFKDAYRANVTDMPTFTVTITRAGRSKTVVDYLGLSVGMPKAMVDLENAVDLAANTHDCVVAAAYRH